MALLLTFVVAVIGFTASNAARVVFPLYALSLGAQPFEIGVLTSVFFVGPLLLSWAIGAFTDRAGPRWPLWLSVFFGTVGAVLPYFAGTMPVLYLASALSGLSFALFLGILQNLVGLLSAPEHRAQNFSNFSMTGAVATFLAPLIAGFSIDGWGNALACLVVAGMTLVVGAILWRWGSSLPGGNRHIGPGTSILKSLRDPGVVPLLTTSSFAQLGTDLFQFYIPIYGYGLGYSASAIGGVLASFAVACFVARFVLSRLIVRYGGARLLAYSFYIGAFGFVLIPFFQSAVALAVVAFIFGFGTGCSQPLITTLMFSHSTHGRTGEALGLRLTANNVARLAGPFVFGGIGSAFGIMPVFFTSAAMMGAGGLLSRASAGGGKQGGRMP
ncbi:MAG: MFS transporter [Burkholderiales bacterium]